MENDKIADVTNNRDCRRHLKKKLWCQNKVSHVKIDRNEYPDAAKISFIKHINTRIIKSFLTEYLFKAYTFYIFDPTSSTGMNLDEKSGWPNPYTLPLPMVASQKVGGRVSSLEA